jgi:hypothetical protein
LGGSPRQEAPRLFLGRARLLDRFGSQERPQLVDAYAQLAAGVVAPQPPLPDPFADLNTVADDDINKFIDRILPTGLDRTRSRSSRQGGG